MDKWTGIYSYGIWNSYICCYREYTRCGYADYISDVEPAFHRSTCPSLFNYLILNKKIWTGEWTGEINPPVPPVHNALYYLYKIHLSKSNTYVKNMLRTNNSSSTPIKKYQKSL